MNARHFAAWLWCSLVFLGGAAVYSADPPPAEVPVVPVAHPVERQVTDHADFTGRTQAVSVVELRARVSSYLVRVHFKDGAEVKKGDVLFDLDPRPYQAQVDQAVSQVALAEASLKLARAVYERDTALNKVDAKSVAPQQLDQDRGSVEEAQARVAAARASAEFNKLNLAFTKVTAPLDGRIGRRNLDPGNLVVADNTVLATILSEDPMYTYFDIDERTLLRLRRAVNDGKVKADAVLSVTMGLADEEGFPHRGTVDFTDHVVNAKTGTVRLRATFANPKPAEGVRLLSPGMFVRVRLPLGAPYKALLVTDRTVLTDQEVNFVYVTDADNKVQLRRVETGPLQPDGLRVVRKGLKPDDLVVLGQLQQLRPKMVIKPEKVEMPVLVKPLDSGEKRP